MEKELTHYHIDMEQGAHGNISGQLEHLFFFVEPNKTLVSKREYSPEYLNKLAKFDLKPKIKKNGNSVNWWGEDIELSSKVKSYEFAKKNNLCPPNVLICDKEESLPEGHILKMPMGFSGKGHFQKNKETLKPPYIVEPKLERVYDVSTLFFKNQFITYENIIGESFNYKGTIFFQWGHFSCDDLFENWKLENFKKEYKEAQNLVSNFIEKNTKLNAWSMDSFFYKNKGEISLYSLCEWNLRKTMGLIAFLLGQKFAVKNKRFEFFISPKLINEKNIIKLSPEDNKFHTYLRVGD